MISTRNSVVSRDFATNHTDESLLEALKRQAKAQGKTSSEVIRDILQEVLTEQPLVTKTGHFRGRLKFPQKPGVAWRQQIRNRNWRSCSIGCWIPDHWLLI